MIFFKGEKNVQIQHDKVTLLGASPQDIRQLKRNTSYRFFYGSQSEQIKAFKECSEKGAILLYNKDYSYRMTPQLFGAVVITNEYIEEPSFSLFLYLFIM